MNLQALFNNVVQTASPKTIFGEPIPVAGKTIVPLVKIRYAFGGGSGQKGDGQEHGGGGGGAFVGKPVGVIEVTQNQTRFIPIPTAAWNVVVAIGIGIALGLLIGPKRVEVRVDKGQQRPK